MKVMNVSMQMKMKSKNKEIIYTEDYSVSCQGREYPYDHPLVYLEIKKDKNKIDCPYCGKEFVVK